MIKKLLASILIYSACMAVQSPSLFLQGFDNPEACRRVKILKVFEQAFKLNHYKTAALSSSPRIPKIIHHIWVGGELPEIFHKYVDSWKEHHPNWEHRLWTDKDVENFEFVSGDAYFKLDNPAHKADILRLEILHAFGGLYVDTDFLCLKSHDQLHYASDFYAGFHNTQMICNALIASVPKHPIIQACLSSIRDQEEFSQGSLEIAKLTGSALLTQKIRGHIKNDSNGIIIFPPAYFYPFPGSKRLNYWRQNEKISVVNPFIKPETLSIHLWAVSWINKYG